MTFSESQDELYPPEKTKHDSSAEDEEMVESGADGVDCAGREDGEQ